MLNVYLAGLLQYILFRFFYLYAMFSAVNLGNIMLQRHCWFTGSCLLFSSPLIYYFHVIFFLVCLFVLLQFARLGFCKRNWNCVIPMDWLFLAYLFIVSCLLLFDSNLQGSGPAATVGPFGAS
jgi:hypothetical protein